MIGGDIGSYRVTAAIGEGGMGAVYLAEHKLLGKRAAVKVLLPELSNNQDIVQRFFNEARATTQIRHPSIVEVFDFGYHTDGSAFIVMEYLDGESLTHRLRRFRRLPLDHAVSFARQIAGALGAAHATGIVHRDLKPDNIFIVRDPEVFGGERIKILDFGIAKIRNAAIADGAKTRTGSIMGTPVYMSPEQCRGLANTNHRTDIYALGCVFFELICGRPPFPGDGIGQLVAAHVYSQPPAPSSIDPSLPPELDRIMARMLEKNPDARYQVMGELMADLDAFLPTGSSAMRAREGSGLLPISAAPQQQHAAPGSYPPMQRPGSYPPSQAPGSYPPSQAPGSYPPSHAPGSYPPSQAPGSYPPSMPNSTIRDAEPPSAVRRLSPSTTLGSSTGERSAIQRVQRPRSKAVIPVALVSLFALVGGGIAIVSSTGGGKQPSAAVRDEDPVAAAAQPARDVAARAPEQPAQPEAAPAPAAAAAPATVKLLIESEPSGADVYRAVDGVKLGTTPYTLEVAPVAGDAMFLVKQRGYENAKVSIPADRDGTAIAKLVKLVKKVKRPEPGTGPELLEPL